MFERLANIQEAPTPTAAIGLFLTRPQFMD